MPLYRQYKQGSVDISVWKITETADELSLLVGDDALQACCAGVSSEKRLLERLAVRAMLSVLFGAEARILYDTAGKPSLAGVDGNISISHTRGYAVMAFSSDVEVGVDAELISRNVLSAASRFMPSDAFDAVQPGTENRVALLHWCAKEALFKITGDLGGNFKDNISLAPFEPAGSGSFSLELVGLSYNGERHFVVHYDVVDDLLLAVCLRAVTK